jgi:hypothetical protein
MGWVFSLLFIISGVVSKDPTHFIAAGLFAIAGTISINSITNK